jgi:hypothetical protein
MTEVKQGSRTPNIGKRQTQEYKSSKPIITSPHFSTEISNGLTPKQILDLKVCDPAMGSGAFLVEVCRQLADHLVAAWRKSGVMPDLPPDEDPLLHARRLVAQKCIYGVD